MCRFGATGSSTFILNRRSATTFETAPGEVAVFELPVEFCVRGDVSGFCVHVLFAIQYRTRMGPMRNDFWFREGSGAPPPAASGPGSRRSSAGNEGGARGSGVACQQRRPSRWDDVRAARHPRLRSSPLTARPAFTMTSSMRPHTHTARHPLLYNHPCDRAYSSQPLTTHTFEHNRFHDFYDHSIRQSQWCVQGNMRKVKWLLTLCLHREPSFLRLLAPSTP